MTAKVSVPTVYILHGNDSLAMQQFMQEMLQRMGDDAMADLNTSVLDGRQASEEEVRTAATSMPFLAERRLVILHNPLARLGGKGDSAAVSRFIALLNGIPPTTALLLVIEDQMSRSKGWETLKDSHWLQQWMRQAGAGVFYKTCVLPEQAQMASWIMQHARKLGGSISSQAAALLAGYSGNNTRIVHLEIEKLLTYVNFERQIEVDDVEVLTAPGSQAGIFDMVDALAVRDGKKSMQAFYTLLEKEDPAYLFTMIVRQFRLLLQAREIIDEGGSTAEVASQLSLASFVARKLEKQVQSFSMPQLESVYHDLLNIDEDIKTSRIKPELALSTFIYRLSHQ